MMTYWFKPKRYGYGATPITWQGWAVTIGSVVALAAMSLVLQSTEGNPWGLAALLGFDLAVVAVLVIVTYLKTDGEWRWRWGDPADR